LGERRLGGVDPLLRHGGETHYARAENDGSDIGAGGPLAPSGHGGSDFFNRFFSGILSSDLSHHFFGDLFFYSLGFGFGAAHQGHGYGRLAIALISAPTPTAPTFVASGLAPAAAAIACATAAFSGATAALSHGDDFFLGLLRGGVRSVCHDFSFF
jgi:hypothetical protein